MEPLARRSQIKEKGIFFLYCARFALPLASPKVLSLDNKKEKGIFFLYCAHLIVPLQRKKIESSMTAIQLNAMNVELWQSIGAIADSEPLMKRLTRYAKKLVMERNADSTAMTKEEFFARVDESLEQARQGRVHRIESKEDLHQFLNSL